MSVTTVPERRGNLLPRTLASLAGAGFVVNRLFVDGEADPSSWRREFGLEVTCRWPTIRTAGNWHLALLELLFRHPDAERYAMFQDDAVFCKNIRQYIERCQVPPNCYLNCWNFRHSETQLAGRPPGWYEGALLGNGPPELRMQKGLGAVALVFNREAVLTLLSSRHMVERPLDAHRGWRAIDGGIVTAFNKAGWRELVHFPSLTQHVGEISAMGNKRHRQSVSFPGDSHDALEFLACTKAQVAATA